LFLGVEIVQEAMIQERGKGVSNLTIGIIHKLMIQERPHPARFD